VAPVAETLELSARRVGRHAWVEMRLFEILGRWSGTVNQPRAQALFASHSHHHAWHAELWHGLLPAVPHLAVPELVAPDEADAVLIARLDALDRNGTDQDRTDRNGTDKDGTNRDGTDKDGTNRDGTDQDGTYDADRRLRAVYREALPHLVRTYSGHLDLTTPVTDGPTIRVLRLVLADLDRDRAAGDALIDALGPVGSG
jgi:hypothetical protein